MKVHALRQRTIAGLAVIAVGLLVPAIAPADEAVDRKAEAQRLFAEGQAALEKGDNPAACTLMRQSLELFAVANSLFNVAQCDERDGKLALALEHWQRGLSLIDATDKRTPVVKKSIEGLEARVPRVRIVVSTKFQPFEVLLDDEPVSTNKLESPVLVDAGKHVITLRKKNHADRRAEIVLNERERTEVVIEPGEAVVATPVPTTSVAPPPPPPPPAGPSPLKIGGFVGLGVGGAALLGAAITGGVIVSNQSEIDKLCPKQVCTPEGRAKINDQQTLMNANAALWVVGIAGAAAGAVMLVISSRSAKENKTPSVAPLVLNGGGGLGLSGRF